MQSRRRFLQAVGVAGTVGVAGVGTASARRPGPSIVETALQINAESGEFSTLIAALVATDLIPTLDGNRQLTVFAPTDAAFASAGLNSSNVGSLDPALLTDILLYHVTAGRRKSPSVVGSDELEMLNGDIVTVDGTVLNDGQAEIVAVDVEASNGIIHVISGVLLP